MSTWLITGCSTGLGRALAIAVLEAGHDAVITARDPQVLAELGDSYPETAAVVPLDVRDHDQIIAAVDVAKDRFGGVDVLVNNAGYGYRSALEEGDPAEVEQLFATNFFGAVDVMKQVLPGMRERGAGTIVNVSSIAGRTSQPGSGYYSATKFALEGASDALSKEVGPLGVRVVIVEPGGFRTDFAGRSLTQSAVPIEDYADTAGLRRKENATIDGRQPGDPVRAAQAILQVVASDNPPLRLLLGSDALRRAEGELVGQRADIDAWVDVTRSTDFPE
ncbi:MAG: oxidoreductase [Brevibacterium yomogidense]|uniref:Short-chain dehydrogenase/reductase SDR n=1 Tax=Brevibacterium yomogidense TaxID=946573 RepID=A0A1X6WW01_9MICO|nr:MULTISPECIES: oxidoreductase [Brevibacterium]SLM89576.1 Short-chain dehydrogenase/reductase SDR [Brevibacterium yomogidense]SMX79685.1 Short-chain dehydrogenase [Brevibacterium sp. Mu109]